MRAESRRAGPSPRDAPGRLRGGPGAERGGGARRLGGVRRRARLCGHRGRRRGFDHGAPRVRALGDRDHPVVLRLDPLGEQRVPGVGQQRPAAAFFAFSFARARALARLVALRGRGHEERVAALRFEHRVVLAPARGEMRRPPRRRERRRAERRRVEARPRALRPGGRGDGRGQRGHDEDRGVARLEDAPRVRRQGLEEREVDAQRRVRRGLGDAREQRRVRPVGVVVHVKRSLG